MPNIRVTPQRSKRAPQPRTTEIVVQSKRLLPPKKIKFTKKELTAVPARVFPGFPKLARELQEMIWVFSLNDPIVETTYDPKSEQFRAADFKVSILEVSGLDPTPYNLQPIYLRPNLGKYRVHRLKSRPGVRVPSLPLDPIYVRPDDIVYMPEIYKLDVDAFLSHKENKVIENLAINTTLEGKLVRGLANLKTLYVVDGSFLGQESREKHPGNCNYILKEVVEGKGPPPGGRSWDLVPWNSGTAHVISLALDFEATPYDNTWRPPNVIFRELIRQPIGS
jgi:hypothetical protein